MRFTTVFLACALFACLNAPGASAEPLQSPAAAHNNFASYLRLLFENHPELKALKSEADAKGKAPSQEYSLQNPQLRLGIMDLPTNLSFSQEDMTRKVIGLTQAFPAPGKRELRKKSAEEEHRMSQGAVAEKRLELAEQARTAFFQMDYLQKSKETVLKNKEILHGFIDAALSRYSTGLGVQQDVLAAQIEYSRMAEYLVRLEQELAVVTSNLNVWAGLPPDTSWAKPEIKPMEKFDADLDGLVERGVANRPVFKQLEAAHDKSTAMSMLAKKELVPDYSVGLSYAIRENGAMPRSNLITAEFMFDLPLYKGTRQNQMIAQSALMEQKTAYEAEAEKLRLRRDVSELLEMQKRDERLLALYDTGLLPQARQSVDAAVSAYRVNKVDFRWLVMNQATLFDYELRRYRVEYELNTTRARLIRTLGEDDNEVKNEN